jgi:hypothetical protein
VPTDIVEGPEPAILAENEKKGESGNTESAVVANFLEEGAVADMQPGLAEDGTPL